MQFCMCCRDFNYVSTSPALIPYEWDGYWKSVYVLQEIKVLYGVKLDVIGGTFLDLDPVVDKPIFAFHSNEAYFKYFAA